MNEAAHAVVAGVTGGIGGAICSALVADGYRVTGLARARSSDHNCDSIQTLCDAIVEVDFENLSQLVTCLDALVRERPIPDALILAAGYGRFGAIEQFSPAQIRQMIDVNLTAQLLLLRGFVPAMKRLGRGRIVVIGSESALQGRRYGSIYSATKFALRGSLQALRQECAGRNVHLTLINPGMVRTSFFDQLDFEPAAGAVHALDSDDVAAAVIYALSARDGACVDEINLNPIKNVVRHKAPDEAD